MSAYIFDSEWTDKNDPEIIEAAWHGLLPVTDLAGDSPLAICRPTRVDRGFHERFVPQRKISFGAISKHHIFPEDLVWCRASSSFRLPDDCHYLIGHSIDHDWKAYVNTVTVNGAMIHSSPHRICTHAMATHIWQEADAYSLVALVYMLEGPAARDLARNAHGAAIDVVLCRLLLDHILNAKPEIITWDQLFEFSEASRIPIYCPFKNRQGVKLVDLDDSYIDWCLSQGWIDPYLRKGLENVLRDRGALDEYDDDDDAVDDYIHHRSIQTASSEDADDIPF